MSDEPKGRKQTHRRAGKSTPRSTAAPQSDVPRDLGVTNKTMAEIETDAGTFWQVSGSKSPSFNEVMLSETLRCLWGTQSDEREELTRCINAGRAALAAFKAKDEIEAMLAAQAVALHFGAMECLRRSMLPEQPSEIASKLRKDGANLARGMTEMLDALDRKRGKGPQVVRVERVVVQDGGQAIVGAVATGALGGGVTHGLRQEPHTSPAGLAQDAAAGAGGTTLRSADAERVSVPVPGDGER